MDAAQADPPRIYLDHAASTPLDAEVRRAMEPFLDAAAGNPSSAHAEGRRERNAIDDARHAVARGIGAQPREVVFTSGGTEANGLAIRGVLDRMHASGRHIVTTAIEHEAVLETCTQLRELGRADVSVIGCDGAGRVDPDEVAAAVRDDTVLVSVMLANNEVGTIQDVAAIAERVHARNAAIRVHTDAVQAVGHIDVDVEALGVDLLSASAHKLYGPRGAGCLWVRHGVALLPQLAGGGQERGRRSGTENTAAIVGFGAAVTRADSQRVADARRERDLVRRLNDALVAAVPDIVLTGSALHRLPSIASYAVPGAISEVMVAALDGAGIAVSAGSACSSGAAVASHVLAAMDLLPGTAAGALRVSVGRGTSETDIETAAIAIVTAILQTRISAHRG